MTAEPTTLFRRLAEAIAWARASTISQRRDTPAACFDCLDSIDRGEVKDEARQILRALGRAGLSIELAPLPPEKPVKIDPSKPVLCRRCMVAHPNMATAQRLCGGKVCLPRTPADAKCDEYRCKRKAVVFVPNDDADDSARTHAWCEKHWAVLAVAK